MNHLNVNMIDGQWYWMKVETIFDYHHQLCLNWALVLKVLAEALISYPCFFVAFFLASSFFESAYDTIFFLRFLFDVF